MKRLYILLRKSHSIRKGSPTDCLLRVACAWIGSVFRRGQAGMCAEFVRMVFENAGMTLPVAPHFTAWDVGSLDGDTVGERIEHGKDLEPGDIVLFYAPVDYAPCINVLRHVGVYVGHGLVVHRPYDDEPVQLWGIEHFGYPYEGRRPRLAVGASKKTESEVI